MALQKVVRNMLNTGVSDSSDATAITIDSSENVTFAGTVALGDNKNLLLGASSDLGIKHDGSNSKIENNTGDLYIINEADDKDIIFQGDDGGGNLITALTLDMSEAGKSTFNSSAIFNTAIAIGQSTFTGGNTLMDMHGSGSTVGANIAFANDHNTDKLYVGIEGNTTGDAMIYQAEDADINFYTNNTFRAKLDNSGNLGLGTTSPNAKLDILGTTSDQLRLRTAESEEYKIGRNSTTGFLDFHGTQSSYTGYTFGGVDGERMRIDANGNVGVGHTSPSSKLHVAGAKSYVSGTLQNMLQVEDTSSATTGVGGGIQFLGAYTGTTVTTGGSIEVKKANATGNDYAFNLVIKTRDNGSSNVERARFGSDGGSPTYGRLTLTSSYGSVEYGAANSSYHHFIVDSGPSKFYFSHRCEAAGGFHTYSDENLKKDITPITGALDDVAKMNGVTFKWKDAVKRGSGDNGKQFGVTAQNMLTVDSELPTINKDPLYNIKDDVKSDDEYYTMDYSRLTPYFIEAIKELKTKLEAAEAKIEALEG